jgi:uncharacterized phage protein gp47/JayE
MTEDINVLPDVNELNERQLGNILYHIAANTETSKGYTRRFIQQALQKASEMLYRAYEGDRKGELRRMADDAADGLYATYSLEDILNEIRENHGICRKHGNDCNGIQNTLHSCVMDRDVKCGCCQEGISECFDSHFSDPIFPDRHIP